SGPLFVETPWGLEELNLLKQGEETYPQTLSHQIFSGDKAVISDWYDFAKRGTIAQLFRREINDHYSGEVTIEDLEDILDGIYGAVFLHHFAI
ncbi:MAG: hypothetical protein AAFV80_23705, partial [Bacteroidota bacterium]